LAPIARLDFRFGAEAKVASVALLAALRFGIRA
jgi:hypothetical protein